MIAKPIARLATCAVGLTAVLLTQQASCLPFWDAASVYPLTGSPPSANLAAMTNVEGNIWGRCGGNTNGGSTDVNVVNYPLTYPGLECSDSNSFLFGFAGTNAYSERIAIHPAVNGSPFAVSSGTVYYSYVFTIPAMGQDTTGGFICGLNNTVGSQANQPTVAGARIYILPSGSGYLIGIGKQPGSSADIVGGTNNPTYLSNVFQLASTNFVVCAYTFGSSSKIWVNPDPSTFGAVTPPVPDAINTNGSEVSPNGIETFLFRQGNVQIPEIYAADLRVGLCWACVTPPAVNPAPQPATLAINKVSTNQDAITFATNSPCFLLTTSTNLPAATNNWKPIVTDGTPVVAGNFGVTNTVPTYNVITTNVVGNVTNFTTNTYLRNSYYQVKTYAN